MRAGGAIVKGRVFDLPDIFDLVYVIIIMQEQSYVYL